jgi:hypothetical protein
MVQLNQVQQDEKIVDLKLPFPWKLHKLLEGTEANMTSDIVSWLPDGKAFKVHDTKAFTDKIMPSYFSQTKYNSFKRQCYIYGMRLRRDGAFYHPKFRRGDLEASLTIKRNQEGDRRKKTHDGVSFSVVPSEKQESGSYPLQGSLNTYDLVSGSSSSSYPSTIHKNSERFALNLFEPSFPRGDHSPPPQVQEEIKDLAYNIFENSQYFNAPFSDLINLDFTFKDTDLDSLEDVFRLEVQDKESAPRQVHQRPPETIIYSESISMI